VGVVIVAIDEEGPAAQAGITRGDILLTVNDVEINSAAALYGVVTNAAPGDEVTLVVQHGDETRTITLTLGQNGDRAYLGVQVVDPPGAVAVEVVAPAVPVGPGVAEEVVTATTTVTISDDVTSETVVHFGPGLIVAEVLADGPAAAAGLVAGDLILAVDGQPVALPEELLKVIQGYSPGDMVTLTVQKGGPVGAAVVEIPVTLGSAPDEPTRAYLGIRFVVAPASVAIEAVPSTGMYTAPAIPVAPPIPAYPEYAPGYGYPGAYAGDVCGMGNAAGNTGSNDVTIEQYFYAPADGAPVAVPLPPMVSVQPALPAAPVYIYHSGVNSEAYGYGVAGKAGQVEKDVIFWRAAPVMPGVEAQRFEVQLQPGKLPMQQEDDVIYLWKGEADEKQKMDIFAYPAPFTQAYPAIPSEGDVQKDVIVVQRGGEAQATWTAAIPGVPPVAIYGGETVAVPAEVAAQKHVVIGQASGEAQTIWSSPVVGEIPGQPPVVVYSKDDATATGAVKVFTVQVAPESGAVQVVAPDLSEVPVPVVPELWY
jgi:hypothetical protein